MDRDVCSVGYASFSFLSALFYSFYNSLASLAKLTLKQFSVFYAILREVVFIISSLGWSM